MTISLSKIRALYTHNNEVREFFDFVINTLKHSPKISHVDSLAERLPRRTLTTAFALLSTAGVGEYKRGRWQSGTRMIWSVALLPLALYARGDDVDIAYIVDEPVHEETQQVEVPMPREKVKPVQAPAPEPVKEFIRTSYTHHFSLRPGVDVVIEIPEDLTASEATRLANFIKSQVLLPEEMPKTRVS